MTELPNPNPNSDPNPNPERLRREAKRLRRDFLEGDADARGRVLAVLPEAVPPLRHAQALHVLARERGYGSWPRLKFAAERLGMDRSARAERLKVALYEGQGWIVEELLAADPDLGADNLGLRCALYDRAGVAAALAAEPEAATRIVGVRSPLLHLVFSRYHRIAPDRAGDALEVARLLLERGADPNDSYSSWDGHPLSALYGALGHAGHLALAEWLLEHGADPDDSESLYHATELGHLDGVRLLMRYGVTTLGTNALNRMLDFDDPEGLRLFLEYGADPNETVMRHADGSVHPTIPALHQAARRGRGAAFAELLLAHGADPGTLWEGHTPYALARIMGNRDFAAALDRAGHATVLSGAEAVLTACAEGEVPPGRPLEGMALGEQAAGLLCQIIGWPDRLDHAKRLVAAGFDPDRPDGQNLTPLHLAGWHGLPEQLAWLLTLGPDLEHVNGYGGDLVDTIAHGAANAPRLPGQDHAACARLALEAGAALRPAVVAGALDEEISALLRDWAETHAEAPA